MIQGKSIKIKYAAKFIIMEDFNCYWKRNLYANEIVEQNVHLSGQEMKDYLAWLVLKYSNGSHLYAFKNFV